MRKHTALILAIFYIACLLLSACYAAPAPQPAPVPSPTAVPAPTPVPSDGATPAWQQEGARDVSVWAAYWDTADVVAELAPVAHRLKALCYFEAYFSPDGTLRLPEALPALYQAVEAAYPDNLWANYLTFVNDVQEDNGTFTQKTTDILAPFLADEAAMDAHIDQLIACVQENGFDGVEIDYEALRKAPALWEPFTRFCARLYARTQAAGLSLRVVLEPYAPFADYAFPQGPVYVVMCYNLYGGHSAPGPKADYAFLADVAARASLLPGRVEYALATGGYDWRTHSDASQLTQSAAQTLFSTRGVGACTRDGDSGALTFRYKDENKKKHTVWYADAQTLALWANALRAYGAGDLAYWRLGGNGA